MFSGQVIRGDGLGKKLGFPTANLNLSVSATGLSAGVYAARVFWRQKIYFGALAIQKQVDKVEVHLLDYLGPDFYGDYLQIESLQKVAEMESFENERELKNKITKDLSKIKKIIN